jgi:hypothetical protein
MERVRQYYAGADPGGGHPRTPHPPKIGKNMIFWRKIVIFHHLKKLRRTEGGA